MTPPPLAQPGDFLRSLLDAAVAAADPMRVVPAHLGKRPDARGRVVAIGAGKASARMAEAVERSWGPVEGLVVTRAGHDRPCRTIETVEAAHPVPDAAGIEATRRILELAEGLGAEDFALVLISGGGSALLCAPKPPMSLSDKREVHRALLESGAPIGRMNVVRKHLSAVKGGRLAAAAYPARVLTLAISDVPGDDPADIASGPTVGESSLPEEARRVVRDWGIELPETARSALEGPSTTIPPGDPRLARAETRVIAAPSQSLAAAARAARGTGCAVEILGDAIEGEAASLGAEHARLALSRQSAMNPGDAPALVLSGGECTVSSPGPGVGGPNAEYALAAAIELDGAPGIHLLACDTDGIDGAAEVAGAAIGPHTLSRAREAGLAPREALERHDSHGFFGAIGGQVMTGPTLTNVNDFRAILVEPRA